MTGLSRAGYYRWRLPPPTTPVAMELRNQLQQVAVEWPAYGYRRITAELQRRGYEVNHKRVLRLMGEDNLLCLRRRSFVVTTDSGHPLRVYPNLARNIRPEAINRLWIADITYIRLRAEFVYLAVVLDAFSRRVIGWALGRTLEAKLAVAALRMAIDQRKPAAGLVHHSDRGVQYASTEYTVASVPQLLGCHTQARSLDEVTQRVREAIELCLEVEGAPERSLEFIGIQRITIAA